MSVNATNTMHKNYTTWLDLVKDLRHSENSLFILNRKQPTEWQDMLSYLSTQRISWHINVQTGSPKKALQPYFQRYIHLPYVTLWLEEVITITQQFGTMLEQDYLWLSLTTQRVCSRFHVDKTDYRALITYCGMGTEWKYAKADKTQHIAPHDIAIFKGNSAHIMHKSPADSRPSLLLRIDTPEFKNARKMHCVQTLK